MRIITKIMGHYQIALQTIIAVFQIIRILIFIIKAQKQKKKKIMI